MNGRIVKSDTDCADCLCRVCARNPYIDCDVEYDHLFRNCEPCFHCVVGESMLVEIEDDCTSQSFLPVDYL